VRPAVLLLPLLLLIARVGSGDELSDALRARRYEEALAQADAGLEAHPGDPRLWTGRGLALAGLGRDRDGIAAFEKALESAPGFLPALKGAVEVAYRARDPRAAAFLERLIRLEPANGTAHAMAGVLAFEAGDCAAAVRHFESARSEVEANSQAYRLYGDCLLRVGRGADALPVFERLAASRPEPGALRSLAAAQVGAGHVDDAVATARRAIAIAPESEQNYVELASTFLLRELNQAAMEVLNAGLTKLPRSARLYGLRGVAEAGNGLDDAAARDFEASNRLDPGHEYGAAGLGVLYAGTERAPEASAILRRRLQKDPQDATLNYLLAQALTREGGEPGTPAYGEARDALVRAVRARPDYAAAHSALGKLYVQAGDDARALAEFQTAAKLDPGDRTALSQLAAALRRAGRNEEALAVSRRLRELVIREAKDGRQPSDATKGGRTP